MSQIWERDAIIITQHDISLQRVLGVKSLKFDDENLEKKSLAMSSYALLGQRRAYMTFMKW